MWSSIRIHPEYYCNQLVKSRGPKLNISAIQLVRSRSNARRKNGAMWMQKGQKYYGRTLPISQRGSNHILHRCLQHTMSLVSHCIHQPLQRLAAYSYKDWLHQHILAILFNRSVLRNLAWETNTKLVNLQLWPRVCWSLGAWLPTFAWYFTYDLTWNLALVANASHRMSGSAPNRPDFPEQDQNVHQLHLLFDHQNELVLHQLPVQASNFQIHKDYTNMVRLRAIKSSPP